jgi:integrase
MAASTLAKRIRHQPVKGAPGVYRSRTKKGWVYEVRFPANAAGRRLYEVVGTRLDAAKARAHEIHAGGQAPSSVATTVAEVYADWKKTRSIRKRSEEMYDAHYRTHIAPALARRKVRDLDSRTIQGWLAGLKRKDGKPGELATGTRCTIYATLKVILRHAVDMGVISAAPNLRRGVAPKAGEGRKRVLSLDEERTLLAYCARSSWLRPMINVALHQALRMGEVAGLQWEDVDFVTGKLTVRHTLGRDGRLGPTKGGRVETIQLTPVARETLLDLRMQTSEAEGLIFRNGAGNPYQLRNIQRAFDKARRRAGLDDVVFHSLRHTGISRLANHPAIPLVQVRDFARHTNLATTMGYMHKIEDERMTVAFAEALAAPA